MKNKSQISRAVAVVAAGPFSLYLYSVCIVYIFLEFSVDEYNMCISACSHMVPRLRSIYTRHPHPSCYLTLVLYIYINNSINTAGVKGGRPTSVVRLIHNKIIFLQPILDPHTVVVECGLKTHLRRL